MSSDPRLVVRNHAHLEPHPIDSDRAGEAGASGFAIVCVGVIVNVISIGT